MAEENKDMGGERIIIAPIDPNVGSKIDLGYAVPKLKLEGGRRAGLSVPTLERMAELQDAKTHGNVVVTDNFSSNDEAVSALISQITSAVIPTIGVADIQALQTPRSDNEEDDDESKPFGLGSTLRGAQGKVVRAYKHIRHIVGLTADDLDGLLERLKNPKTQEGALQEIEVLDSMVSAVRKSSKSKNQTH